MLFSKGLLEGFSFFKGSARVLCGVYGLFPHASNESSLGSLNPKQGVCFWLACGLGSPGVVLGGLLRLPHDDAGTVVNPRVPDVQIEAGIVGEPWPANPKAQHY